MNHISTKGNYLRGNKKALAHIGYKEIRIRGSHHHFENEQGLVTTVKFENPVDVQAVKDAKKRMGI